MCKNILLLVCFFVILVAESQQLPSVPLYSEKNEVISISPKEAKIFFFLDTGCFQSKFAQRIQEIAYSFRDEPLQVIVVYSDWEIISEAYQQFQEKYFKEMALLGKTIQFCYDYERNYVNQLGFRSLPIVVLGDTQNKRVYAKETWENYRTLRQYALVALGNYAPEQVVIIPAVTYENWEKAEAEEVSKRQIEQILSAREKANQEALAHKEKDSSPIVPNVPVTNTSPVATTVSGANTVPISDTAIATTTPASTPVIPDASIATNTPTTTAPTSTPDALVVTNTPTTTAPTSTPVIPDTPVATNTPTTAPASTPDTSVATNIPTTTAPTSANIPTTAALPQQPSNSDKEENIFIGASLSNLQKNIYKNNLNLKVMGAYPIRSKWVNNIQDCLFWTWADMLVVVFPLILWGLGIIFSIIKYKTYQKMGWAILGCAGFFLWHLLHVLLQIPLEISFLYGTLWKSQYFLSNIYPFFTNWYIADSITLIFGISLVYSLSNDEKSLDKNVK